MCLSFLFSSFLLGAQEKAAAPSDCAAVEASSENSSKGTVFITATTDYEYVMRFGLSMSGPVHYSRMAEGGEIVLDVEPGRYRISPTSGDVMTSNGRLHLPCSFSPKEFTIEAGGYIVITATL